MGPVLSDRLSRLFGDPELDWTLSLALHDHCALAIGNLQTNADSPDLADLLEWRVTDELTLVPGIPPSRAMFQEIHD
jgi:hypothetical protein